MSKLNFEQAAPPSRDVGGPPSWVLLLVADILIAGVAGLAMIQRGF
jgi:hypothetical protein